MVLLNCNSQKIKGWPIYSNIGIAHNIATIYVHKMRLNKFLSVNLGLKPCPKIHLLRSWRSVFYFLGSTLWHFSRRLQTWKWNLFLGKGDEIFEKIHHFQLVTVRFFQLFCSTIGKSLKLVHKKKQLGCISTNGPKRVLVVCICKMLSKKLYPVLQVYTVYPGTQCSYCRFTYIW